MLVLGLIICIVLRALSTQAKVVHSFDECERSFYKGIAPSGMDQNAKKICQMLRNEEWEETDWDSLFFYATLYSTHHKIPLYSAYTLDSDSSSDTGRKDIWHLEPQISQSTSLIYHMVRENQNNQNLYKESQAISRDYSGTGYDRGHLNPNSFQSGDGRNATFTLTNAAPMDACFNRIHWKDWESTLKRLLKKRLDMDHSLATAFIVTGTVPNPNVWMRRVSVPSHIWTAVCYKHYTDDTKSLSFGYIGRNQPAEPGIRLMSVSDLNDELSRLYSVSSGTNQSVKIFVDECFGFNKASEVQSMFNKLIDLPVNQAVQMSSEIQKTFLAVKRPIGSDNTPGKRVKVSQMTVKFAFDSMNTYYKVTENLKVFPGSACLITNVESQVRTIHDELRKREISSGSDAVECLLVSEKQKTAADGSRCSSVYESDNSYRCDTGGEIKPRCSFPCLYQDKLNGYRCYSDQTLIDCSPHYSLITHKGQKCLDDYPCAKYGEDYYWCKTSLGNIKDDWDYCSPPLRNSKTINGQYCRSNHACAKYDEKYTWCYTDDEDNWDHCSQ